MFGHDRDQLRRFYFTAWQKYGAKVPLQPLEQMVAEVIALHPEYHALFSGEDKGIGREYLPEMGETNPYLHMGLHISIREQIAGNLPPGVREAHQSLLKRTRDVHAAEHIMMDVLAETLWQAQRDNLPPDEKAYLRKLRKLAKHY